MFLFYFCSYSAFKWYFMRTIHENLRIQICWKQYAIESGIHSPMACSQLFTLNNQLSMLAFLSNICMYGQLRLKGWQTKLCFFLQNGDPSLSNFFETSAIIVFMTKMVSNFNLNGSYFSEPSLISSDIIDTYMILKLYIDHMWSILTQWSLQTTYFCFVSPIHSPSFDINLHHSLHLLRVSIRAFVF